jgi:hypothetical protein
MTNPPAYCTQNAGNCPTCSLVNYRHDCANNPLKGRWYNLAELAEAITGGNLAAMAKVLNDCGLDPKLDELDPDPGALVAQSALIDLAAVRAGDIVGRRAYHYATNLPGLKV